MKNRSQLFILLASVFLFFNNQLLVIQLGFPTIDKVHIDLSLIFR